MIGWARAARATGCAMPCYVTPKEHLGLPNKTAVFAYGHYSPRTMIPAGADFDCESSRRE